MKTVNKLQDDQRFILANWPAPSSISALTTTVLAGNLALHVEDCPEKVLKNRQLLRDTLNLPDEPAWLHQTHSTTCVHIEKEKNREADAAITQSMQPLTMLTADCLPIALCNKEGTETALIHAGWRGLVNGIIENTLVKMTSKPQDLMAWIGPSICGKCFEVGEDVYNLCTNRYHYTQNEFSPHKKQLGTLKWLADLPNIAAAILNKTGIKAVYQSRICTMENEQLCYSYRKNAKTGRMATLIWFNTGNIK